MTIFVVIIAAVTAGVVLYFKKNGAQTSGNFTPGGIGSSPVESGPTGAT